MDMPRRESPPQLTIAIVGGGFSGSVLALKLTAADPALDILLIERDRRMGRGLAYGACGPEHLLNVPVSRMELGFSPRFAAFLDGHKTALADAVAEAGGDLNAAFVPRALFGDYLQGQVEAAVAAGSIRAVKGEVVAVEPGGRAAIVLADGRRLAADRVVLATGNLPPASPFRAEEAVVDSRFYVPDPWAADAFDGLDPDAPVLLVGAGLTMVDIALKLAAEGHRGLMLATSRRGLAPRSHRHGGAWTAQPLHTGLSPRALMSALREQIDQATAADVPWQRVFDTARPVVASVWSGWSLKQRRQFLRHLRTRWDVHRHRMAPRIGAALQALLDSGQLRVTPGRLRRFEAGAQGITAELVAPHGAVQTVRAARIVNCTGPRSDFGRIEIPLVADLRRRGLLRPDPLGLGLDTNDCAMVGQGGTPSAWLYALGPLTRPAWWEVTAVPEIAVQADRLVKVLTHPEEAVATPLSDAFIDLGAGI
jgi:uncharacterized NAD(P)/FAD-binding protein YdhS